AAGAARAGRIGELDARRKGAEAALAERDRLLKAAAERVQTNDGRTAEIEAERDAARSETASLKREIARRETVEAALEKEIAELKSELARRGAQHLAALSEARSSSSAEIDKVEAARAAAAAEIEH